MTKWAISISVLPMSNILLGFNYQTGEFSVRNKQEIEEELVEYMPRYFEEYSIGILFISFTVTKYMF